MSLSPTQMVPSPTESPVLSGSRLKWYFTFFVISGFCGLVYEVIWVRLAGANFGVTAALISIVLSIFMAGLGLGSWGAGILTRRFLKSNGTNALRLYCLAELLIGCSAVLVPMELKLGRQLMLHMGSLGAWQSSRYYFVAAIWMGITLMPWCTCLGSTFPLLMAVIRQNARFASERSFSYLYMANVVGAFLGTLASAFVLIELLGFQGTLYIAASLNVLIALMAFRLSFNLSSAPFGVISRSKTEMHVDLYGIPRRTTLLLLFITGLVTMGTEVVWIRQFTPYLGNFVYAFALILSTYLLATYFGARDYRKWARSHNVNQSATTWTLLAVSVLIPLVGANPIISLPTGCDGLRILSILLFCALTGFLTPLLVDSWSSGKADEAGVAYAFNILGCIVGPLVAGFWLEPWLGERWSTLALSLPLFLIAAFFSFRKSDEAQLAGSYPKTKFVAAVLVAILLFCFNDDYETRFPVREVRRDYAATVIATGKGFDRELLVNGTGMTFLTPITKYIAHLPLASLQHKPQKGLVICFGMGTSFRSMLSWGIQTTAVDLIPSVPQLFPYYHSDAPELVRSPLAKIVVDDGRRFLDGSDEKFDVIVVDPPPPVAAPGSSLLYSREFYAVIKRHLKPGGIFQNWYPTFGNDDPTTASVAKTLLQSFPYVRAFRSYDGHFGIHFLASMEPLPSTSAAELTARMPPAAVADFVEWGPEASAPKEFDLVIDKEISLENLIQQYPKIPVLSDNEPINEYFLLRTLFHTTR